MKKKVYRLPKLGITTTAAILSTAAAGFLWFSGNHGKSIQVPAYSVLRVIDGDTFETKEHQIIRLASVEAPELDTCGWKMKPKKASFRKPSQCP